MSLKTKAKNCEFGDQINLMIRDRIIFGIKEEQIKERLLRESENPTLERIIEMCRATEISKQQIKTLQGEIPVDAIKKKQSQTRKFKENKDKSPSASGHMNKKQSQKQTECKKCGTRHNPKSCPAYGKRCNICKKFNHFSKTRQKVSLCRNGLNAFKFRYHLKVWMTIWHCVVS